jgi:hypothetical protein
LDAADLPSDLTGGFYGLLGQSFHFRCGHSKTTAGFASTSSSDRDIERQQVYLSSDRIDQLDHVTDATRGLDNWMTRELVVRA